MIKKIFDLISNEPSTLKKMEILKENKDVENLKTVLYLTYSPRIKFYIKNLPEYINNGNNINLFDSLNKLYLIYNRQVTGHDSINLLKEILSDSDNSDSYVIERIIQKDLRIGMGESNINKIFPKLIEETPYMGAKSFSPELIKKLFIENQENFSQLKVDGRYCNAIITEEVFTESRNGEETPLRGELQSELKNFKGWVLNGELTMEGFNRYKSNGMIHSIITIEKKKSVGEDVTKEINKFEKEHIPYKDALNLITYTCWDIIEIAEYFNGLSKTPYSVRLKTLEGLIEKFECRKIKLIDTKIVTNYDSAIEHFKSLIHHNLEGTILKSPNGIWKDGKHPWQVKLKLEMDCELKIVGFNYGTGKNQNIISSLNCESSCGNLKSKPTGIKESMMKYIT